jgi:NTP pyrophosphatase (non-canonical NTP hydrolase)
MDPNIDTYQAWMAAKPHPQAEGLPHLALLGLNLGGEAGEAIELIKKHLRDGTPIDLPHLLLELGDLMIIISSLATHYGVSMSTILELSQQKIEGRIARGTLRGSGDDR